MEILTIENKSPGNSHLQITWKKTRSRHKENLNVRGLMIQREGNGSMKRGAWEGDNNVLGKFPLVLKIHAHNPDCCLIKG